MPVLGRQPTLADLQRYVVLLEGERGFASQTVVDKCLLLGEEVGELFEAIRRREGLKVDPTWSEGSAEEELADILVYLCAIANRLDVDRAGVSAKGGEESAASVGVTPATQSPASSRGHSGGLP